MRKIIFLFLTAGFLFSVSCKDTFEEDISGETVVLISPYDNYTSLSNTQQFWWEEIDGASSYNLRVMAIDTANNNQIISLELDSNLTGTQFQYSFSSGAYQWGVKAFNGGYSTGYTYRTFYIDSTVDMSNITVNLLLPSTDYTTNDTAITFSWQEVYNATQYNFEIWETSFSSGTLYEYQYGLTTTSCSTSNIPEGEYYWGIQARNGTSSSSFSSRKLIIDRTAPGAPSLTYPASDDSLTSADLTAGNLIFSWTHANGAGNNLNDSLLLSQDSLFVTPILNVLVSDTTYTWSVGANYGTFYWKVKTIDVAGNEGSFSSIYKFIYQ